ncbi:hypothetical protein [Proteus phage 2207-N35]|nr:hypothetical protein [Proteus phage 2207-N35]
MKGTTLADLSKAYCHQIVSIVNKYSGDVDSNVSLLLKESNKHRPRGKAYERLMKIEVKL